jgi:hypothetical protein
VAQGKVEMGLKMIGHGLMMTPFTVRAKPLETIGQYIESIGRASGAFGNYLSDIGPALRQRRLD